MSPVGLPSYFPPRFSRGFGVRPMFLLDFSPIFSPGLPCAVELQLLCSVSLSSRIPPDSLTVLECSNCPVLASLPATLPASLHWLNCSNLPLLSSLPASLPASLQTLTCSRCPLLTTLPTFLPTTLVSLQFNDCPRLAHLPTSLPDSLDEIIYWGCPLLPQGFTIEELRVFLKVKRLNRIRFLQRRYRKRRRTRREFRSLLLCAKRLHIELPVDMRKTIFGFVSL
jgi:hypothetical protein